MFRLLPTQAMTPSRTPPMGASDSHVIRFAQTLNGYDDCGGRQGLTAALMAMPGLHACTLHQLRLQLFMTQRQHYDQGGSWGPEDPLMEGMRELCAIIRTRVLEQRSALLTWTGDITKLDVDAIVNGAAQLTPAFGLPATHVMHSVGPQKTDGEQGGPALLAATYTSCMSTALNRRFQSIAFAEPPTVTYGLPKKRAEQIATQTVHQMLTASTQTLRVIFVRLEA